MQRTIYKVERLYHKLLRSVVSDPRISQGREFQLIGFHLYIWARKVFVDSLILFDIAHHPNIAQKNRDDGSWSPLTNGGSRFPRVLYTPGIR